MSFQKEATERPTNILIIESESSSSKSKQPCPYSINISDHNPISLTLKATDFVENNIPKHHSKRYYLTEAKPVKQVLNQKYSDVTKSLLNAVSFLKEKVAFGSDDLSKDQHSKFLHFAHDAPNCGFVKNFNKDLEPCFKDAGCFKPRRKRCEAIEETGDGCVNCGIAYKVENICKNGTSSEGASVNEVPCVGCRVKRGTRGKSYDREDFDSEVHEIQCVRLRGRSCDRVGGCGVTYKVIGKTKSLFAVKGDREDEEIALDSKTIGSINPLGILKLLSNTRQGKNAVHGNARVKAEQKGEEDLVTILKTARQQKAHMEHIRRQTVQYTDSQFKQSQVEQLQVRKSKIEELRFPLLQPLLEPPIADPMFFSLKDEPLETVEQKRPAIAEGYIDKDETQKEGGDPQRLHIEDNNDPRGLDAEMVEPEVKAEEEVEEPFWGISPIGDVDDIRHLAKRRPKKRTGVNWKEFDSEL